ncbi:MAG: ATP-binding protein, partial [Thermoleophilaceae bacterium]|nr:ATP-binding protein [Thermoleophilaceae bacterium]
TSLILKVLEDARRIGMNTVYVDFYGAVAVHEIVRRLEEAYLRDLAGPVRRAVLNLLRSWSVRGKAAPGGVGGEVELSGRRGPEAELSRLLDLPSTVYERTAARTLVVFDEFQDFLRAQGHIDGLIRSKIQFHRDQASYLFAGSEPGMLAALFSDRKRPLYDQARPIYLGPLPYGDLSDHIAGRFEQGARDPGEALDALLDLVRGHPQRAMLLAHHLWEQTARGVTAGADEFAAALQAVQRETDERFEQTWLALAGAPNQRRVLLALAQSDASLYSRRTLEAFALEKGGAESGLRGLIALGEVQEVEGGLVIVDPLLERWARRRGGLRAQ